MATSGRGLGEIKNLICYCFEYKVIKPFWKAVCRYKLEIIYIPLNAVSAALSYEQIPKSHEVAALCTKAESHPVHYRK